MAHDEQRRTMDPIVRDQILAYQREQLQYIPDWLRFRGLSQKHIANELGVSEGVVSRYISGKAIMAVGTLRKIAVLLQASEGDIIRPPTEKSLAPAVEETLAEMDRLGPERWARILATAKDMKGRDEK
jgi:transcriptional regulator with XRE-family HTH domain